jgi:3-hydroxyacyl-CoA dehydrogenase
MRKINKVAILGSGVMGSRIACHFANIGVDVILLDIVPKKASDKEAEKGLSIKDKIVRDRIVNEALNIAIKTNPSPLYKKIRFKKNRNRKFRRRLTKNKRLRLDNRGCYREFIHKEKCLRSN